MSTNFWKQKFVENAQQCFAFTPQANFPAHNLNSHTRWRWWDRIQAIFLNLFYFTVLYFFSVTLAFPFKSKCTSYTVNFLSSSFPLYFHFSCLFLLEEKRHQLWLGSYILLCNPYFTYMGMIALETDLWIKEYGKHWRWNFFRSSTKNQSPMFFGKRLFCNSCE